MDITISKIFKTQFQPQKASKSINKVALKLIKLTHQKITRGEKEENVNLP